MYEQDHAYMSTNIITRLYKCHIFSSIITHLFANIISMFLQMSCFGHPHVSTNVMSCLGLYKRHPHVSTYVIQMSLQTVYTRSLETSSQVIAHFSKYVIHTSLQTLYTRLQTSHMSEHSCLAHTYCMTLHKTG